MDRFDIGEKITLQDAKATFQRLMRALSQREKAHFLSYIEREWQVQDYSNLSNDGSPDRAKCDKEGDVPPLIKMIIHDIKNRVPFDAILPSERIEPPKRGENSDCDVVATVHVDGFLYDDEEMDTLIETGRLQNNFCAACGSKNIRPCIVISHSASFKTMEYIFHTLLPVLRGKTVLDIGSRLGAVLYSAYVLSVAEKIIGVEMNEDLCKLQRDVIERYDMTDRIEVVHKRIEDCPELVHKSDVILINNAFEFYVSEEVHVQIWKFLKTTMRRGTILVTCPKIEQTFNHLETGILIQDWLKPYARVEAGQDTPDNLNIESLDYPDIGCYEVL